MLLKKNLKYLFPLMAIVSLSLFSCDKEKTSISYSQQLEIDKGKLRDYLTANNIVADSTPEGLYFIIDSKIDSSTTKPTPSSNIQLNYKGYLLNGKVFDSGNNVTFNLSKLIEGWQVGLVHFSEGDKGRLFIPSGLAYGTTGSGSIPPNSPLIFDITLLKVLE
ncbi:MAG: FKBP-type peptidyl-prolyl cis-trans isomerase [Saprospiraceae bacterium]|jgi:FKBP-type peptidyl-prolyl cis-trans isomerase|nr:FKBP-type peptidyl-prolyl cis-trans isomerase [Saprospiraceae bacterium]